MCGLVGLIVNTANGALAKEADLFEQLLYIDALRGDDATGMAIYCNTGEIEIAKEATTADYFRSAKEYKEMRLAFIARGRAILGHNRKRTIGEITDETAHPFIIGDNAVFSHNGTLRDHKKLADTVVDSEALGIHLNKCGGDPRKIEEALGDVYGAYACAWFDQNTEKLYLLRNKERPLYLAKYPSGYIYASEPGFIYAAANRNAYKIEEIEEVPEHTLVSLSLDGSFTTVKKEALVVPKKSQAPSSTVYKGGKKTSKSGGVSTDGDTEGYYAKGVSSKNSYKRFRQRYIGKRIEFWIEDYMDIPNTGVPNAFSSWSVTGSCDRIGTNHTISAKIHYAHPDEMEYLWSESLLTGIVEDVYWNPNKSQMEIKLTDLKMIEFSNSGFKDAANETPTSLH